LYLSWNKALVTGGAGFIGSRLVNDMMNRGCEIVVLDNLSAGKLENLQPWLGNSRFKFLKMDMLDLDTTKNALEGCDIVFHLAANPDVRIGASDTKIDYEQNISNTYRLLEAMRNSKSCKNIVFTSSSTIYGDANIVPTPECYGPLKPISLYGASKLAAEAMISAYSHLFGIRGVICRLANIVGPGSAHGVIYDFVDKLRKNPKVLQILGDGSQNKSYLYVDDCTEAITTSAERAQDQVEIFNVGSNDTIDVLAIAEIVLAEMNLKGTEMQLTNKIADGRGWKGDVKKMLLDISKINELGWGPHWNSRQAVRLTVKGILNQ
jgi:UDP-glucose 4-epimerase